jgi:hypothetical protein
MNSSSFDLTLEQQFEFRQMKEATKTMSREQALELLIQASRLLMIKTNVMRELMKQTPLTPME